MDNSDDQNSDQQTDQTSERIAKALARAGVGSRRDVERMIGEGRIKLDGKILDTPATLVTGLDGILVDGQPVTAADEAKLWRFHKPKGVLTTHKDPEGRPTVFEKLPPHLGRVVSVGRLDMNTEGLLLLTNDGELARYLELPSHEFVRRYRVRVYGTVDVKRLEALKDGATIDGVHYGPVEASIEGGKGEVNPQQKAANVWLKIAIREGKNREVRRLMQHLDLHVNRLIRSHYGPFALSTLPLGAVDRVGGAKLRPMLPDYFKDTSQSVAVPEEAKASPKKWARAKPKHDRGVKKRKSRSIRKSEEGDKAEGPKAKGGSSSRKIEGEMPKGGRPGAPKPPSRPAGRTNPTRRQNANNRPKPNRPKPKGPKR